MKNNFNTVEFVVTEMLEKLGWDSLETRKNRYRLGSLYNAYYEKSASISNRLIKPSSYGRRDHKFKIKPLLQRNNEGKYICNINYIAY